jgi:hypothetical protein
MLYLMNNGNRYNERVIELCYKEIKMIFVFIDGTIYCQCQSNGNVYLYLRNFYRMLFDKLLVDLLIGTIVRKIKIWKLLIKIYQ